MGVSLWVWFATVAVIIGMLAFDFYGHVRTPHAPTLRESATWSIIYVTIGIAFSLVVLFAWGAQYSGEYLAGFITEKSLSVDNLFVFVLIMASFRVPREYQQKVLLFGIAIALIMRTGFILAGAALIERFTWIFYIFGAFLVYTAWTQVRGSGHDPADGYHENGFLRLVRRIIPVSAGYQGDRFFGREKGRTVATPMFVVILAIGSADLLFAVDSIPAIFGLTQEAYLVFTANAFALLGLRQLFFLIDGLLDKLVYLSYGLGAILAFIGLKLINHALHYNTLPFINGGEPVLAVPEPSIAVSLGFIIGVLVITTVLSLTVGARRAQAKAEAAGAGAEGTAPGGMAHKAESIGHAAEQAHRTMRDYEEPLK